MTVSSSENRKSYAGNGSTTVFSYPYLFLADADLKALLVNDTTGAVATQTLTTDYTVSGAGGVSGSVTMVTAPPTGYTLVIYSDPEISQLVDAVNGDPFDVDTTIETPLDRLTLIARRLNERMDRAMRLSDGDTSSASVELPVASPNKLLGWNAAGDGIENKVPADLTSLATITIFAETLLDDATSAEARATLDAVSNTTDETITGAKTLSGKTKFSNVVTHEYPVNYASASGTDTYTVTLDPAISAYQAGNFYAALIANANTSTTPTIDFNSVGGVTIVNDVDGGALVAGSLGANKLHLFFYDGTYMRLMNPAKTGGSQTFTASGSFTWRKCTWLLADVIGGGAGGGSGRLGGVSTVRNGGSGGGSGARAKRLIANPPAAGTSTTVTVGAAGVGGAAQNTSNTNGNNGTDGGSSSFGSYITAAGGVKGLGGGNTSANISGGAAGAKPAVPGGGVIAEAGSAGATMMYNATPSAAANTAVSPAGGGAGGAINATNNGYDGGNGGSTETSTGGAGSVTLPSLSAAGGDGSASSDEGVGSGGGGSGAGGGTSAGTGSGRGGDGGTPGGGGAGSGAATNGSNGSGRGGNGGRGEVRLYWG